MDVRIKGERDGIETAQLLRGRFDVPVIFLTAHADASTIQRARQVEAHGYLLKPVKDAELHGTIEVALFKAEMDRRLREREAWYATTLESITDAVVTVDLAGRVTYMNPAAAALTGVAVNDAVGRPARDVVQLVNQELPLERALRGQAPSAATAPSELLNSATGARRAIL